MNQVLSVVAVIDTPTPAEWIVQLLDRLQKHPRIDLSLMQLDPLRAEDRQLRAEDTQWSPAVGQPSIDAPTSAHRAGRSLKLARHILTVQIDRPRFAEDPWKSRPLVDEYSKRSPVPGADIMLRLCRGPLPDSLLSQTGTVWWDAHVETLDARIENALVTRAPLSWVHLWEHRCEGVADTVRQTEPSAGQVDRDGSGPDDSSVSCRRIASHALPRQTYSLTDLRLAAWFCLPALFESRLNWLAQGVDPVVMEYQATEDQAAASLDHPRLAAHADADRLQGNRFLPPEVSGVHTLMRVMRLWIHQNLVRVRQRFFYEQWQLAYRHEAQDGLPVEPPAGTSNTAKPCDKIIRLLSEPGLADYTNIDMPDRTWWADPHLFRQGDIKYLFFEEMNIDINRGHLSVARLTDEGQVTDVTTILDNGAHLSYPFVFGIGDEVYLIPETASSRVVQLFRATDFPTAWTHVKDLLADVDLADTTVHFDGCRYWLFSNSKSHGTVNERDQLHLFHADELTGEWQAHPMNPVVTGVDRARMAGAFIRDGEVLYRVSQYGAKRYGYGINLYRVDRLDETGYAETIVGRIRPTARTPWLGCHSLSHLNGVTVLDRVIRRRR